MKRPPAVTPRPQYVGTEPPRQASEFGRAQEERLLGLERDALRAAAHVHAVVVVDGGHGQDLVGRPVAELLQSKIVQRVNQFTLARRP